MHTKSLIFLLKGLLILAPLGVIGQSLGIKFESGLSWKAIQAKAKAENKYIFMDCYATWCGPCKWMSENIYEEKAVGEYFNVHFINVAVQMDRTPNDSQSVQDWYADADANADRYNIHAFPTYLFFSPDGHIIHRFSGAVQDKMEFIARGKDAMNPQKQYYTIMENCKAHRGDSIFLLHALQNTMNQYDAEFATTVGNYYLDCVKNPVCKDNIMIVQQLIQIIDKKYEKGYKVFLDNAKRIDDVMGDSLYVERALASTIFDEAIKPLYVEENGPIYWKNIKANLHAKYSTLSDGIISIEEILFQSHIKSDMKTFIYRYDTPPDNWNLILKRFGRKYPGYDIVPFFLERKAKYYAMKKMWRECSVATYLYIHRYGYKLPDYARNDIAWDYIFMHSSDKKILFEAMKLMKPIVDFNPDQPLKAEQPNYIDTYANLLYKAGDKKEAMIWENKAIELQNKVIRLQNIKENKEYLMGILKGIEIRWQTMQKGKPTWEENVPAS